jgi:hypothetical protein
MDELIAATPLDATPNNVNVSCDSAADDIHTLKHKE